MINSIIFDFGDVFLNLEKEKSLEAFRKLGLHSPTAELLHLNADFEMGRITEKVFLEGFQEHIPHCDINEIKAAWNSIIGDFPLHRLEFLQMLCGKYRMFLMTNTDSIHIEHFEDKTGASFFTDFYRCFEKVYYSYEMGMRKPDVAVFNHIIGKHDLSPRRTLFIDDKIENIEAAKQAGLQTWHLQVGYEDVTDLFSKKIL